jgi:hypothetical protein
MSITWEGMMKVLRLSVANEVVQSRCHGLRGGCPPNGDGKCAAVTWFRESQDFMLGDDLAGSSAL